MVKLNEMVLAVVEINNKQQKWLMSPSLYLLRVECNYSTAVKIKFMLVD